MKIWVKHSVLVEKIFSLITSLSPGDWDWSQNTWTLTLFALRYKLAESACNLQREVRAGEWGVCDHLGPLSFL